jgi:L-seryl-tRNA(Ser) seleniumtransferase
MTASPLPLHATLPASARAASLRSLPQVQRLLETQAAAGLLRSFRREQVAQSIRDELAGVRAALLAGRVPELEAGGVAFFDAVQRRLQALRADSLRPVINGTGVVLHTNLGRAPLAAAAVRAIGEVAGGYSSLEYDLSEGARGSRHDHVEPLLCRLTGAQAAVAVNNCAAAVLLALTALARGGEVIVSRGELIEIGGSFRIPDVIAQSGATLVEVGTTNKTRLADYERAIGPQTRLILRTHPSNYRIVGFTEQPSRAALAGLAGERGVAFMEDLGSGTLVDLRRFGLAAEPTVQCCVREGGGIVAFSGDKLLGGPQAGLLVGPEALIASLRAHPLHRALRIDKLSLAALHATLSLYDGPVPAEASIPALRMLAQRPEDIAARARRLARRARRRLPQLACEVRPAASVAGGGSLPGEEMPTTIVAVSAPGVPSHEMARRLRVGRPAVVGRIVDDRFAIDLRTVADDEVAGIVDALEGALQP